MIKARIGFITIALVNVLLGGGVASAQERSVEDILGFINASIRDRPVTRRHFDSDGELIYTCTDHGSIELERFGFLTIKEWEICTRWPGEVKNRRTSRFSIGDIDLDGIRFRQRQLKDEDGRWIRSAEALFEFACQSELSGCVSYKFQNPDSNFDRGDWNQAWFSVRMSDALAARLTRALRALIEAALKDPRYRPY